jgi:hypothetical protein
LLQRSSAMFTPFHTTLISRVISVLTSVSSDLDLVFSQRRLFLIDLFVDSGDASWITPFAHGACLISQYYLMLHMIMILEPVCLQYIINFMFLTLITPKNLQPMSSNIAILSQQWLKETSAGLQALLSSK